MAPTWEWTTDQAAEMNPAVERAAFLKKVYGNLFGALISFVLLELVIFRMGWDLPIARAVSGVPLIAFGAIILISWLANGYAAKAVSLGGQYAGLSLYVVGMAVFFVPILYVANEFAPGTIQSAALISGIGFAGLTVLVFLSAKDFTFMGSTLRYLGFMALIAIGGSLLFKFQLGTWFSIAMIAFAGAAILYDTSNILRNYPSHRYVAGALALFASVIMLFFYVLRLLLASRR